MTGKQKIMSCFLFHLTYNSLDLSSLIAHSVHQCNLLLGLLGQYSLSLKFLLLCLNFENQNCLFVFFFLVLGIEPKLHACQASTPSLSYIPSQESECLPVFQILVEMPTKMVFSDCLKGGRYVFSSSSSAGGGSSSSSTMPCK